MHESIVEEQERRQNREKKQDCLGDLQRQAVHVRSCWNISLIIVISKEEERRAPVFMCRHVAAQAAFPFYHCRVSGDFFSF